MTKKEANELIQYLNSIYIYGGLKKMNREELKNYINLFYERYLRFDKQLIKNAIDIVISKNKFFPNFVELSESVSQALFDRRYEIVKKLIDNKYYEIGMTGTVREIERKAFDRFDKVLVEMILHKYTEHTIVEIKDAVDNIDYLKEYKGLILFDDNLPIPPGCVPNYNYDFSRPTAQLHSHK